MDTHGDQESILPFEVYAHYEAQQTPKLKTETLEENDVWIQNTGVYAFLVLQKFMSIIFFYLMARILAQKNSEVFPSESSTKFIMEFIIIIIPTVMLESAFFRYSMYFLNTVLFIIICTSILRIYLNKEHRQEYVLGGDRPFIITLVRATINILASMYILLEDSPKVTQKYFGVTKFNGIGLMDLGIGLYIFSMAIVERRRRRFERLKKNMCILLTLGFIRLICTQFFNIDHDVKEFGVHWNVFFTMALINFLGTFFCEIFKRRIQRFAAIGVLIIIQEMEIYFLPDILNEKLPRSNFFEANQEGIFPCTGFLALFLITTCIGDYIRSEHVVLPADKALHMLKNLVVMVLTFWILVFVCLHTISFSRLMCNTGYIVLVLAIATTMTFLAMFVFHVILNKLWFVGEIGKYQRLYKGSHLTGADLLLYRDYLPFIVEIMNRNGWLCVAISYFCAYFWRMFCPGILNRFENILYAMVCMIGLISTNYHLQVAGRLYNVT